VPVQSMIAAPPARIFVGIKVADAVATELAELARPLGQQHGVRLLSASDIHLTLLPPWNEFDIAAAAETLRTSIGDLKSFCLTFVHIRYGQRLREPHLLWGRMHTQQRADGPVDRITYGVWQARSPAIFSPCHRRARAACRAENCWALSDRSISVAYPARRLRPTLPVSAARPKWLPRSHIDPAWMEANRTIGADSRECRARQQ